MHMLHMHMHMHMYMCMFRLLAALLEGLSELPGVSWTLDFSCPTDPPGVEKKYAPLTYDATNVTSNLVLLHNAQTQTRPTDHPRHDQP